MGRHRQALIARRHIQTQHALLRSKSQRAHVQKWESVGDRGWGAGLRDPKEPRLVRRERDPCGGPRPHRRH